MAHAVNLQGKKFGRITVIERGENAKNGTARWLCRCDCGNYKLVRNDKLRYGEVVSCGCYLKEKGRKQLTTHGLLNELYGRELRKSLSAMKYRCNNPHCSQYKNYGARGIKVCEEWETSFAAFYQWAINHGYKKGLSIDRIDNNKGYSPDNCRWIPLVKQQRNKRNNRLVSFNGKTACVAEWCETTGLTHACIVSRLEHKWTVEETLTKPSGRSK